MVLRHIHCVMAAQPNAITATEIFRGMDIIVTELFRWGWELGRRGGGGGL